MKVLVLGSGTCVPSRTRNAPGYLVETVGKRILVDCGSGVLRQLACAGRSHLALDAVLVTHLHPDHMSDLLPLLHALKYTPGAVREKTLYLVSPADLEAYFLDAVFPVLSPPRTFLLKFLPTSGDIRLGDALITACPTQHSRESAAFKVEADGRSVVFTGDADYEAGLVDFCRDADLLVADCSFPDEMKMPGHMVPRECGVLAREAGVKHLVLSHLYPAEVPDTVRVSQAARESAGPVSLAEDLVEYPVGTSGSLDTVGRDRDDTGGNP